MGTDPFIINRETYLLVSDYYSKFAFDYVIQSPVTSTAVIAKLKSLFAEKGVPQRVISDNGTHFSSDTFRRFTDHQWCFDDLTSSPHDPQSNGLIERHVQTVKLTLKKVSWPRSDVQMALLVLRATPINSHLQQTAVWKKSGIELTCRNMECQLQEMRNSGSPRPATGHCRRTP